MSEKGSNYNEEAVSTDNDKIGGEEEQEYGEDGEQEEDD